jgi:quercetin dioxygenase-like cupin family protein
MRVLDPNRRSFLLGLGALGMTKHWPRGADESQAAAREGFVLAADAGEHLIHFRDHGNVFINVGAAAASSNVAVGTQQVMRGSGIPVHRHLHMDEAFYVLEGAGVVTLNDTDNSFERGATIFIPRNTWHGFTNADHELLLLWVVTPPGLDGFFRETCTPPGAPAKQLTREQIREIALKYGTEFR